jgi:hypothetical protein
MLRPLLALALLSLADVGCGNGNPTGPDPAGTRILFVGNSLTYYNDLPAMVRVLAESAGTPLVTKGIAFGGFSLEDHWADGTARAELATGRWDVVVLQQGPSAWPSSRENLREWTVRWADAIRAAGAQPVVYMVWPESYRMTAFDSVSRSYREAATAARATLVPGGDAWQAAWRRQGSLALYGDDGFHPSPLGTWVVAVATWSRLTGRPASEAPASFGTGPSGFAASEAEANAVRAAVEEVLR